LKVYQHLVKLGSKHNNTCPNNWKNDLVLHALFLKLNRCWKCLYNNGFFLYCYWNVWNESNEYKVSKSIFFKVTGCKRDTMNQGDYCKRGWYVLFPNFFKKKLWMNFGTICFATCNINVYSCPSTWHVFFFIIF
jgi:hypothetical protein